MIYPPIRQVSITFQAMKLSNILFTALAVASAIIGQSCSRHGAATDSFRNFPDDSVLQEVTSVVRTPFSADTTFKFDGREVPTLQIARIFPTQYSDVFYSIRVFAIKGESPVNTCLARIISEDFAAVAGGDIFYNHKARTATDVNAQIDYYGKVFNDTILPQLRQSVVNGFYVNTDLRPCWVSDDSRSTPSPHSRNRPPAEAPRASHVIMSHSQPFWVAPSRSTIWCLRLIAARCADSCSTP